MSKTKYKVIFEGIIDIYNGTSFKKACRILLDAKNDVKLNGYKVKVVLYIDLEARIGFDNGVLDYGAEILEEYNNLINNKI